MNNIGTIPISNFPYYFFIFSIFLLFNSCEDSIGTKSELLYEIDCTLEDIEKHCKIYILTKLEKRKSKFL